MSETPQQYTQRILGFMSGKKPLEVQRKTAKTLAKLIKPLSERQLSQRPDPGKWSIAEILAHLADSEIVLSWRMRLVICQSGALIQATDQDAWARTFGLSADRCEGFARSLSRAAGEQFTHAQLPPQRPLGKLRHTLGTRQGNHRPDRAHVRRPRPEPRGTGGEDSERE